MTKRASMWKKIVGFLFVIGIGAVGYSGWKWLSQVTVVEVSMQGLVHAQETEVRDLIKVDTGAVMFELDPQILEDRIRRHPWIMEAHVSRLPTGSLDIRVLERFPVAQTLGSDGRIGFYLDRNGFRMPINDAKSYPVPIISGDIENYHPIISVSDNSLREMLYVLPSLSEESDGIMSEIRRIGTGIEIRTTPIGSHESIPVLMGESDYESKFKLLEVFWEREILTHQEIEFASIDLRFASQVVTKQELRRPIKEISN
jgi:cell division protein FtsQ